MTARMRVAETGAAEPLDALRELAERLGCSEIANDASSLSRRITDGRFYVGFVGQLKRGKSTLINALVGRDLLPTGVVPVTAIITVVRHGTSEQAIVHFEDGRSEPIEIDRIATYVSEEPNPGNRKRVRVVEVHVASDLLAKGMCLVDTPGLGSVLGHNTETTRAFVPHIDVALVVSGADPPVSGDEAAIAEEIGKLAPRVLFVLTKADRMSEVELDAAAAFARSTLRARLGRDVRLFIVSAIERIELATATREWASLEEELRDLARDMGAGLVQAAWERGVRRLGTQLRKDIELRRHALTRPIEESEERFNALRATIDDARRAIGGLSHLLDAEQQRLAREISSERSRFLVEAMCDAQTRKGDRGLFEDTTHVAGGGISTRKEDRRGNRQSVARAGRAASEGALCHGDDAIRHRCP